MPDPVVPPVHVPPTSDKPSVNSRWLKIRNWLISIAVILVVSNIVEKVVEHVSVEAEHISVEELTEIDESFLDGVTAIAPFEISSLFYNYLFNGPAADETLFGIHSSSFDPPKRLPIFLKVLLRIIPATLTTSYHIFKSGWISTITALAALFIGYVCVSSGVKRITSLKDSNLIWLMVPLIGSGFVWVLLHLMRIFGELFGTLLHLYTPQRPTYFSMIGLSLTAAILKEREHHLTGKITGHLTGTGHH